MIWFDFDNSPHVPLFRPVLRELDARDRSYIVTARDFAQTKELLDFWNLRYILVGKHAGKNKFRKILNLFERASQLDMAISSSAVRLAVSHGSRSQLIVARRRGIPSVLMLDYEYTESRIFNLLATYILIPAYIPINRLEAAGFNLRKVLRYEGFKEELYLQDFKPEKDFRRQLQVEDKAILVTIRPPSIVGNYHDNRSEALYLQCLRILSTDPNVQILIVNRTIQERSIVTAEISQRPNVRFLKAPVDGLQLIWHSDLVISGGGTMNRESALLDVPTFSIFTGRRPYLDELLAEQGRLTFVQDIRQVGSIPIVKRRIPLTFQPAKLGLASEIAERLCELAIRHSGR